MYPLNQRGASRTVSKDASGLRCIGRDFGAKRPDATPALPGAHHHEECYIANSVRTEIRVEPVG